MPWIELQDDLQAASSKRVRRHAAAARERCASVFLWPAAGLVINRDPPQVLDSAEVALKKERAKERCVRDYSRGFPHCCAVSHRPFLAAFVP